MWIRCELYVDSISISLECHINSMWKRCEHYVDSIPISLVYHTNTMCEYCLESCCLGQAFQQFSGQCKVLSVLICSLLLCSFSMIPNSAMYNAFYYDVLRNSLTLYSALLFFALLIWSDLIWSVMNCVCQSVLITSAGSESSTRCVVWSSTGTCGRISGSSTTYWAAHRKRRFRQCVLRECLRSL